MLSPQHMPTTDAGPVQEKHILIVEDSKIVASFMKDNLELSPGFKVSLAHSLAETEAILQQDASRFFAATLDLHLPDATKGEVVDLVLGYGIPSIVLTSLIDQELRARIEAKGVLDYVLKSRDAVRQVTDILLRLEHNKGVKILMVDDSGVLRRVTSDFLSRFGFKVLEAANGKEALEVLEREQDVPLVITDYEMPEMDGFELCKRIREQAGRNELVIIGVSSHDEDLLSAKLLKAGANDFLAKPFQREELYTRIVNNLDMLDYISRINTSLATIRNLHGRMKRDLEAAAKLQQSLLPRKLPKLPSLSAASLFIPCDELAGDTYNIFNIDDRHLGIFVVDVSGHGVPAALLSVTLSRVLTPEAARSNLLVESNRLDGGLQILDPATVFAKLNEQYPMDPENLQYFTIVYGVLDCQTGTFRYASAGHPGPVLIRKGEEPRTFAALNMAIGFAPALTFQDESIDLLPGDRLYFYTDGLIEAKNAENTEFGVERLCDSLQKLTASSLEASLQKVYESVQQWNAGGFKDDLTICALEYRGEHTDT